MLNDLYMQQSN